MGLPLSAFKRISERDIAPGDLVFMHSRWILAIGERSSSGQYGIALSGADAGRVRKMGNSAAIKVAHAHGWQVVATIGKDANLDRLLYVTVSEDGGPIFHGCDSQFDNEKYSFDEVGNPVVVSREPWERITDFSVWLSDENGLPWGSSPVFTTGA